jgi:hypothetical protein
VNHVARFSSNQSFTNQSFTVPLTFPCRSPVVPRGAPWCPVVVPRRAPVVPLDRDKNWCYVFSP